MRSIFIAFRVTKVEKKNVERLARQFGCGSLSDFIRLVIRLADPKTNQAADRMNYARHKKTPGDEARGQDQI